MYLPWWFLFILFLFLNTCSARPLVAVEESSTMFHINISGGKVPENAKNSNVARKSADFEIKNNIGFKREERFWQGKKILLEAQESTNEQKEISGVVSVSRPHSKQDHNTGFYSDYSRPRTRPASHN